MTEDNQELEQQYLGESLSKILIDSVKENDLKFIFEVLASPSENRTIADLDHLVKIMMHIEPIKKLQSMSAVYFLCKKMVLIKYKSKDIVYDDLERADSLYIVLNGKVALYKKSTKIFDSDQVIFMNAGSCFGKFYQWKVKFIPISVQETLLAVAPKNEVNKIPIQLSYQRQIMIEELMSSDIFSACEASIQKIQQASNLLILSRVPCGNFLIRQGQTPKALFYILKGIVKKIVCEDNKIIEVRRFYQGEYCPQLLKGTFNFELIAETSCEIIVIPKKALKILGSPLIQNPYCQQSPINLALQLHKKEEWRKYKQNYLSELVYKPIPEKQKNKLWR